MKKIMTISLCVALTMVLLVGCTTSTTMKDGNYKAEFAQADDKGWTDYVEITVVGEKITNVVYDSLKDGLKKSEDKDYEATMKKVNKDQTWPADFYAKLTTQLVEKQDIEKVDVVAGATTSSNDFKTLVKELSKKMTKGDTAVVKVKR